MLIPHDDWSAKRNHYYGHLKLPQDAKEFLEPLVRHLNHGLSVLRDATVRGDVRIDTAVHLDALSAQAKDAAVEPLRRAIFASVNGGQNPTPDGGVDQKCETIRVLQNCSVLVVDGIDGRYRVRRKEPEGRVQTHPVRLVSGRGDAGVWLR